MSKEKSFFCTTFPKPIWWLLALIGAPLLFLLMIMSKQSPIEQDLQQRTTQQLLDQQQDWAKIELDRRGRDAVLNGVAPNKEAQEQTLQLAQNVYGVRAVSNKTTLTGAEAGEEVTATTETVTEDEEKQALTSATLSLNTDNDTIVLTGKMPNQQAIDTLVTTTTTAYPEKQITNELTIDENVAEADWLPATNALIPTLTGLTNTKLSLSNDNKSLSGNTSSEPEKQTILAAITTAFGEGEPQAFDTHINIESTITPASEPSDTDTAIASTTEPETTTDTSTTTDTVEATTPDTDTTTDTTEATTSDTDTTTDTAEVTTPDTDTTTDTAEATTTDSDTTTETAEATTPDTDTTTDTAEATTPDTGTTTDTADVTIPDTDTTTDTADTATPDTDTTEPETTNDTPDSAETETTVADTDTTTTEAEPAVNACQDKLNTVMQDKKILFDNDKANIHQKSFPLLNDIATIIAECKDIVSDKGISINGHTDSRGSDRYNQALSERRAGAVKDYLTKKGVNQALMQAIGHGETQPIADNSTNTGRAKNRRITFKIKN